MRTVALLPLLTACSAAPHAPPPPGGVQNVTAYHVLPAYCTGIQNRDTGNFLGDVKFVLSTFHDKDESNNPEDIRVSMLESWLVQVDGDWGQYLQCNIEPGKQSCKYACSQEECRVGARKENKGWWWSFPACGEGAHWTALRMTRRVKSSCLAEAWRAAAGGCAHCGADLDSCVGDCVADLGNDALEKVWDRVLTPGSECPEVPPSAHGKTPVPAPRTPAPAPSPGKTPAPAPRPPAPAPLPPAPQPPAACIVADASCEADHGACCQGLTCNKEKGKHICVPEATP